MDSGHLSCFGHNEVIMLKVLTKEEEAEAFEILGIQKEYTNSMPHDRIKSSFKWPSNEIIGKLKDKGFNPMVFVLGPGEFLHINKGR